MIPQNPRISIQNNKINLKFDYDPAIISAIKEIPGREFNGIYKIWSVPVTDESINRLRTIGFDTMSILSQIEMLKASALKEFDNYKREIVKDFPFLYDYQVEGVAKGLVLDHFLLGDDTGIGKTQEALAIMDYRLKRNMIDSIYVVCPKTIKESVWKRRAKKFFDIDFNIIKGTKQKRAEQYLNGGNLIFNYEQITSDLSLLRSMLLRNGLIIDEASSLKNETTKRYQVFKELNPKYSIYATGTPIEKKLRDGFNIGVLVNPNWMTRGEFFNNYCIFSKMWTPAGEVSYVSGYKNIPQFMERLMEIGIRRKKEDVKQMPGKYQYRRDIELSKLQRKCYGIIVDGVKKLIEKKEIDIKTQLFRCQPFFAMIEDSTDLLLLSEAKTLENMDFSFLEQSHPLSETSPKLVELKSLLEELSGKVVVFTQSKRMIPIIDNQLREEGYKVFSGSGDTTDRMDLIDRFEKEGDILVVNDAFKFGVDMPFATNLVHFDLLWNNAWMQQREDRIYRITSEKPVNIHKLVTDGLDGTILNRLEQEGQNMVEFDLNEQLKNFILQYKK